MLLPLIAPLPDDAQGGRLNGHIAVGLKVATHVLDVEVHTWRVLHARRRRRRWPARGQAPQPPRIVLAATAGSERAVVDLRVITQPRRRPAPPAR